MGYTVDNLWKDDGTNLSPGVDYRNIFSPKLGTADVGTTTYNSPDMILQASAWDTDGSEDTWQWKWRVTPASAASTSSSLQLYVQKNAGVDASQFSFSSSGNMQGSGTITSYTGSFAVGAANTSLTIYGRETDDATAVAVKIGNAATLTSPLGKVTSFCTDAGITEVAHVNRNGEFRNYRTQFLDEFWNGVVSYWITRTSTGSVAAQSSSNGIYRLTTGAADNNEESIDWNDICPFQNTLRPSFHVRLKLDLASNIQVRIGLTESTGVGTDDFICFRINSDTDTNWYLVTSDGGAETTDVGPAATTGTVDFKWEFMSDTSIEWLYSTDGGFSWTSQGTISTNVPTEQLQPFAEVIVRNNGGARYLELDKIEIFQDRI